jgi:hypothetical protein
VRKARLEERKRRGEAAHRRQEVKALQQENRAAATAVYETQCRLCMAVEDDRSRLAQQEAQRLVSITDA